MPSNETSRPRSVAVSIMSSARAATSTSGGTWTAAASVATGTSSPLRWDEKLVMFTPRSARSLDRSATIPGRSAPQARIRWVGRPGWPGSSGTARTETVAPSRSTSVPAARSRLGPSRPSGADTTNVTANTPRTTAESASSMLHPRSNRAPASAATIPGRSVPTAVNARSVILSTPSLGTILRSRSWLVAGPGSSGRAGPSPPRSFAPRLWSGAPTGDVRSKHRGPSRRSARPSDGSRSLRDRHHDFLELVDAEREGDRLGLVADRDRQVVVRALVPRPRRVRQVLVLVLELDLLAHDRRADGRETQVLQVEVHVVPEAVADELQALELRGRSPRGVHRQDPEPATHALTAEPHLARHGSRRRRRPH